MGIPPQQPNQPSPQQIQTALASSEYIVCATDGCGGKMFLPAVSYRRLSKIALATDQDMIVPIDLNVCAKCGSVVKEMLPENMQDDFS